MSKKTAKHPATSKDSLQVETNEGTDVADLEVDDGSEITGTQEATTSFPDPSEFYSAALRGATARPASDGRTDVMVTLPLKPAQGHDGRRNLPPLTRPAARMLRDLTHGLVTDHATLPNGKAVRNASDSIAWLASKAGY